MPLITARAEIDLGQMEDVLLNTDLVQYVRTTNNTQTIAYFSKNDFLILHLPLQEYWSRIKRAHKEQNKE